MIELECPTPNDIAAMVDGSLATERERELEGHLCACAACRELVSAVDVKFGRYAIVRHLGQGGMSVVFAARDPELDRLVAIKVMRAAHDDRLVDEARAMAALSHPNVVPVFEIGRSEHGRLFLVMELVAGRTLREWLADHAHGQREVLAAFVAAGRGLAAAHAAGFVHRDFKPSNVLVGDDGRVRVTDFGLVQRAGLDRATVAGTPAYMSPEQLAGDPVDARSDQFSFCVALARALPVLPPRSARAVARGMAQSPADRFATIDELLRVLEPRPRRTQWAAAPSRRRPSPRSRACATSVRSAGRRPPR